jgi:hypothetical protein
METAKSFGGCGAHIKLYVVGKIIWGRGGAGGDTPAFSTLPMETMQSFAEIGVLDFNPLNHSGNCMYHLL